MSTASDARTRLKDAQRALVHEAILDGAEEVFGTEGYDNAKVQSIAAAVGVSLARLYAAFPGKWDIYRAVHARRLDALMLEITSALRAAGDATPVQQLLTAHSLHMKFHMEHVSYLQMHLQDRMAWSSSEGLRCEEQQKAWAAGLKMMVAALERGRVEGSIVDEDPELLARSALALQQVQLALWVDRGRKAPIDEVIRTAQRQLLRLVCPAEQFAGQLARLERSQGTFSGVENAEGAPA